MGGRAAAMVKTMLEAENVKLHFGKKLEGFDVEGVTVEGGGRVDADLVIFVPAGSGHPVVSSSELPLNDAGFVKIDQTCQVVGHENVYAVGDIAALEGPDWRAKQGHLAEVMANVAVSAIKARRRGRIPAVNYVDQMSLVCLMDSGNGGAFVHRDAKRARVVALPLIGHWLKKAWGYYYRWTKFRLHRWIAWAGREFFTRRRRSLPAVG